MPGRGQATRPRASTGAMATSRKPKSAPLQIRFMDPGAISTRIRMSGGPCGAGPKPASVRYNDWRQVAVAPPDAFTPTLPVSVVIPYHQTPAGTLAMTLAALEGQTCPRELFEVVIVDDGSEPPLQRPPATPLDVKVVRQERSGFGLARARNTGARAAAHDVLLFLDNDMLAEAGWIAAHARWHHAVSDALTVGFSACVAVDGIDAETIRRRPGSLGDLLAGRVSDPPWIEGRMLRTNDLTSRADDPFRGVGGNNFGIRKSFYHLAGGSDESFTSWGLEDVELAYRAYTRGGLLVPARDAFAWHQGRWDEAKNRRGNLAQREKAASLIAHPWLRGAGSDRIYTVPRYVVTIDAGSLPADRIARTVASLLAGRVRDLVVRIETHGCGGNGRPAQLRDALGKNPRVRVSPAGSALDEFPTAPFHVALPATALFATDLVHRLRVGLGDAATAVSVLADGAEVSITRTWALHRARRAGGSPADFGEVRTLSAATLEVAGEPADRAGGEAPREAADHPAKRGRAFDATAIREVWSIVAWLPGAIRWQVANRRWAVWRYLWWRMRRRTLDRLRYWSPGTG